MADIQKVFDTAIHLMDEQNESTGTTLTADTQEYRYRTINILNTLITELYAGSDTRKAIFEGRPLPELLTVTDYRNPDFTQEIDLDDGLAIGVLPYGLAALLVLNEDEGKYRILYSMYMEKLQKFIRNLPADWEPITPVYGLF